MGLYAGVTLLILVLAACSTETSSGQVVEKDKEKKPEKTEQQEVETTRMYTDALTRDVEIPTNPQRVVALWSIGEMLALDTKPIGATSHLLRFYSDEEKQDVEIVGDDVMGDYENILELNPDLILVYARATEEELAQYSKIAPTVATAFFGDPFESLKDMGDILNKQEQAEQWIEDYNKRIELVHTDLADLNIKNEKALVLQLALKNMYIYNSSTFPTIYDAYEFELPDAQRKFQEDDSFVSQQLSLEVLPEFSDADRIFIIVNDEESKSALENLKESSIWNSLPAVENNQVYEIGNRLSTKDVSTLDWALDEVQLLLKGEKK